MVEYELKFTVIVRPEWWQRITFLSNGVGEQGCATPHYSINKGESSVSFVVARNKIAGHSAAEIQK